MKKCTKCKWEGEESEAKRGHTDGSKEYVSDSLCPVCESSTTESEELVIVSNKKAGVLDVNKDGKVDMKDAKSFVKKVKKAIEGRRGKKR